MTLIERAAANDRVIDLGRRAGYPMNQASVEWLCGELRWWFDRGPDGTASVCGVDASAHIETRDSPNELALRTESWVRQRLWWVHSDVCELRDPIVCRVTSETKTTCVVLRAEPSGVAQQVQVVVPAELECWAPNHIDELLALRERAKAIGETSPVGIDSRQDLVATIAVWATRMRSAAWRDATKLRRALLLARAAEKIAQRVLYREEVE